MNAYEAYMNELATQMRSELTGRDFESLETSDDVTNYMNNVSPDDTTFVVINSTCGCAAGLARPAAVTVVEQNEQKPTNKVTVFAGQDKEATQQARDYFEGFAPSSPSFSLVKDGKVTEMIERHQIEGHDVMDVINQLQNLFDTYCDEK